MSDSRDFKINEERFENVDNQLFDTEEKIRQLTKELAEANKFNDDIVYLHQMIDELQEELVKEKKLTSIIDKHLFDSDKENEVLNKALKWACIAIQELVEKQTKSCASLGLYISQYIEQARKK